METSLNRTVYLFEFSISGLYLPFGPTVIRNMINIHCDFYATHPHIQIAWNTYIWLLSSSMSQTNNRKKYYRRRSRGCWNSSKLSFRLIVYNSSVWIPPMAVLNFDVISIYYRNYIIFIKINIFKVIVNLMILYLSNLLVRFSF